MNNALTIYVTERGVFEGQVFRVLDNQFSRLSVNSQSVARKSEGLHRQVRAGQPVGGTARKQFDNPEPGSTAEIKNMFTIFFRWQKPGIKASGKTVCDDNIAMFVKVGLRANRMDAFAREQRLCLPEVFYVFNLCHSTKSSP
jgi:hypothetical protein